MPGSSGFTNPLTPDVLTSVGSAAWVDKPWKRCRDSWGTTDTWTKENTLPVASFQLACVIEQLYSFFNVNCLASL